MKSGKMNGELSGLISREESSRKGNSSGMKHQGECACVCLRVYVCWGVTLGKLYCVYLGCGVALLLLELWLEWNWGPSVLRFDCVPKARDLVLEVFLAWQCRGVCRHRNSKVHLTAVSVYSGGKAHHFYIKIKYGTTEQMDYFYEL